MEINRKQGCTNGSWGGGYKVSVEEYQVGKREMARKGSMVFGEAISLLALNIIKQRGER